MKRLALSVALVAATVLGLARALVPGRVERRFNRVRAAPVPVPAAARALEERSLLLDLAHASPAAIGDALALARRPVVVSHTGVRGTCDNARNLSDAQLQAVARTGGMVGIGFWSTAVCGRDASAIARAALHAVRVAGVDHVGMGSDFDGGVVTPFDAAGYGQVTAALRAAGLPEADVAKVMGGNVVRLLKEALPKREGPATRAPRAVSHQRTVSGQQPASP